jgi:hypothetical protein
MRLEDVAEAALLEDPLLPLNTTVELLKISQLQNKAK